MIISCEVCTEGDDTKMAMVMHSDCQMQRVWLSYSGERKVRPKDDNGPGSLQPEGGVYEQQEWERTLCDSTVRGQSVRKPGHERFGGVPEVTSYLYHSLLSTSLTCSPTNGPSQIPAAVSNLHTTALVEKEGKSPVQKGKNKRQDRKEKGPLTSIGNLTQRTEGIAISSILHHEGPLLGTRLWTGDSTDSFSRLTDFPRVPLPLSWSRKVTANSGRGLKSTDISNCASSLPEEFLHQRQALHSQSLAVAQLVQPLPHIDVLPFRGRAHLVSQAGFTHSPQPKSWGRISTALKVSLQEKLLE